MREFERVREQSIRRRETGLGASRLNTREVEQRIDELERPQRILVGEIDPRPVSRPQWLRLVGQRILQRPEHERQGRPEFMTDVAEEFGLGAVELLELLGCLPQRFVCRTELVAATHDFALERAPRGQ